MTTVTGRHPLHRIAKPYPLITGCGLPVVAGRERRAEVGPSRRDVCRTCFPDRPPGIIRLGRHQRPIVRRALNSRARLVYPCSGKREMEALRALLRRGILVPAPGLPGAYRIASDTLSIHLQGSLLQHPKG